MRQLFCYVAALSITFSAWGQQIPRAVVAEHFTNTYCSICASRNPGLFTNLNSFPQVIHLAYYPSSPYAACPLSMHNAPENDARTNYYGIYGGTPQLVVSGSVVTGSFTNPSIFSSQLSATTSFALTAATTLVGTDSISVQVVVKKVDTSSISSLQLFAILAEDTLSFTANNGETHHYNVFRKAFWGTSSIVITPPSAVGDSSIFIKNIARNTSWNTGRLYSIAILQKASKEVVQATKSAHIPGTATGIEEMAGAPTLHLYPSPATQTLFIDGYNNPFTASISDASGRVIITTNIDKQNNTIDISRLKSGVYILSPTNSIMHKPITFIKW